jgi:succinate-semialdehyde dehydrogenase / glutarate-semialdehyde dehydrogenase
MDAMEIVGLFIDGCWVKDAAHATFPVENPLLEEAAHLAVQASEADTQAAIDAAARGFATWRNTDPWMRTTILRRIAQLLRDASSGIARTITIETGKPLRQAMGEVATAADYFEWFADEARRIRGETIEARGSSTRLNLHYQPIGVAAVLTSWNFPVNLPARKIAAALAAGCAIICRPSEEAPASTAALFRCMEAAGLPAGVANLLNGAHQQIVPTLMADERVRKISFTGSTEVGRTLMRDAAQTIKKVGLELGGHASAIVFADADVDRAARELIAFKFRNAGQICISPSRFFVHESVYKRFVDSALDIVKALRLGDGLDETTDVGPLINRGRRDAIENMVDASTSFGSRVLAGGQRPPNLNRGYFYEPTILVDTPDDAKIMREEPFGPVVPISRFKGFDEVITRANNVRYGLANYLYTGSLRTAHEAVALLESGMIAVNNAAVATIEAPFGGIKQSGFGTEGGSMGIEEYLVPKFTRLELVGTV